MDTKKLYNEIYLKTKIGEAAFRRAFNGAVRYIASRYGIKYATDDTSALYINNVGEKSSLYDAYASAVQCYIENSEKSGEERYSGFTSLADLAYRTVWREKNKSVKIRGCSF